MKKPSELAKLLKKVAQGRQIITLGKNDLLIAEELLDSSTALECLHETYETLIKHRNKQIEVVPVINAWYLCESEEIEMTEEEMEVAEDDLVDYYIVVKNRRGFKTNNGDEWVVRFINEAKQGKYELTDETMKHNGKTLHRIVALSDFGKIKKGDKGGWVESEKNLDQKGNAWIADDAKVYSNAKVYGNAWITNNAQVYGDAKVYGNTTVSDEAKIYENAQVRGSAQVYSNSTIHGKMILKDEDEADGGDWSK